MKRRAMFQSLPPNADRCYANSTLDYLGIMSKSQNAENVQLP